MDTPPSDPFAAAMGCDILLIEDSSSQALQIRLLLQRSGYQVCIVGDGADGWRAACAHPPRLILLDVNLPTLDGFQVLTRLKHGRATAPIPVVMLTERDHTGDAERAIALGAADYLSKEEVLGRIAAVVEQHLHPDST